MRLPIIVILTALASITAQTGQAANWQKIASDGTESVEIDKARIARIGGKTMAWSRLWLGREMQVGESGLNYSAVEALNRYDCENRSFATVKRVYRYNGKSVKQETVDTPVEMQAAVNSVDDKLLTEACKLRTVGEMKGVAEAADRVAAEAAAKPPVAAPPKAMYADMRSARETKPAAVYPVEATPPAKIGLPSKEELAAMAAAEKPASITAQQSSPAAAAHTRPLVPPSKADTYTYLRSSTRPSRKKAAPVNPVPAASEVSHAHWSYEGEGAPTNWGKLRPDYATCASGKRQSPIDIREGIRVDLEAIKFDYQKSFFRIIDNGHTIQVNVGSGSTISVMGSQYELIQLHFHRPSEERVNGKAYDMVVHLVHKDMDNHLAVIAVLLEKGTEQPVIQTLWNNLPLEVNQDVAPNVAIDLNGLLPENRNYWTYMGSLTTPPCSEDVLWMVFKQPVQVSAEQVSIFSRLYRNNARPVQPGNNRIIKESR
ncbi:MAG: carbonic anhydrase family protein [Sterolibacterium sp.]|nr:carbonic anhydrase family protein [Sterolibacterium sp.]